MQNPFPVYHSPHNNHQLFNICHFTCVTKNKTYQFVLLSHAVDFAGLVSVLVSKGSGLINKPAHFTEDCMVVYISKWTD